jgi:hypothetical protein
MPAFLSNPALSLNEKATSPAWKATTISDQIVDCLAKAPTPIHRVTTSMGWMQSFAGIKGWKVKLAEVSGASAFTQLGPDHGCRLFLGYIAIFVGVEAGISIVLRTRPAEEDP